MLAWYIENNESNKTNSTICWKKVDDNYYLHSVGFIREKCYQNLNIDCMEDY